MYCYFGFLFRDLTDNVCQPHQTAAFSEASKVHNTPSSNDTVDGELEIMRDADGCSSTEMVVTHPVAGEMGEVAASECAQEVSIEASQVTQGSPSVADSGGADQAEATRLNPLPQPHSINITELEQVCGNELCVVFARFE